MATTYHFNKPIFRALLSRLFCIAMLLFFTHDAYAQRDKRMIRMAKIEVDTNQLEAYHAALLEQMHTAIRKEPGVLSYYAVADKKDPSKITIMEIYADSAAYKRHIATTHFKKYKTTVEHMVKKLELVDLNFIGSAKQPGL
ncbi:putative quinol monooxygenase [Mucilaginibacter sp. KACC 22773]|uniref:putative quinol monooxygenase n=1 Tax=Mucilaginibacter sp. KACC 22773 TaxID=3025671 RepID=UPI00236579AC|nr:putative quinol monooxygenase [Mucilaginibacter sp. KACC 22773]WDF81135.1 putative quinol monooxygenase [Mucilaginibacter sp. KACC 22773]